MLTETYQLANGVTIPKIGYGTWMIADDQAAQRVVEALEIGYRHIDTAQAYENEVGVGQGIKESGLPREEIFVTTKLRAEIKDYEEAKAAIDGSLERLGLDYIDLMIIHSPKPWDDFQNMDNHYYEGNLAAWKALEEAYDAGKLRAIGVSNFEVNDLENLLNNGRIKPMVNQILAHIGHTPTEVIAFSQAHDILVEAYSPIAHGEIMRNQMLTDLAAKYQVSVPQLAIRYCLDLGLLPLPKTENPDHMKANADVNFTIEAADLAKLKVLKEVDYGTNSEIPVFKRAVNEAGK